jgi:hypothetical protein
VNPALIQGGWWRESLTFGDTPPFECQSVVWLQAGNRYADLRVAFLPGAGDRCFAGRTKWDGDRLRWYHDIDLDGQGSDDSGHLSWQGDALIERGLFDCPDGRVPYEEVWRRLPDAATSPLVVHRSHGCIVRTGKHAIVIEDARPMGGPFSARYQRLGPAGWASDFAIERAS